MLRLPEKSRPSLHYLVVILAVPCLLAERDFNVRIPMRDGVRLSTNVYLPESSTKSGALLVRTPYGKGERLLPGYNAFIKAGYAVVVQDVRGRYASEGSFRTPAQETDDSDDTVRWIVRQPWSDGLVGMLGGSYLGIVQWRAALAGNRHLVAISPVVSGCDEFTDRFYSPGGALKLGHRLLWIADNLRAPGWRTPAFSSFVEHLPLRTADRAAAGHSVDLWQHALDHPTYDRHWRGLSVRERLSTVQTPALIIGGWYDNYAESDLQAFSLLRTRSAAHRIVIGPWGHNMSIEFPSHIAFGPDASAPIRHYQLDWFNHWMRSPQPVPEFAMPPVRIFVMGINKWRDEREWPLSRARPVAYYLGNTARANSAGGDGILSREPGRTASDTFVYDPRLPVPTQGGAVCCDPKVFPYGPMDQRTVERREDVLVYTSAPLKQDLEVTGPVEVTLHVSTTVPDTDFTAKLVDVHPDGHARNLCDGILRLRYREGLDKLRLAKPGQTYAIRIQAGVTSNVFRSGHRIRLEVSSSNFPRFDRNLNTGRANADEREIRVAKQTVLHGGAFASHVLLPVVPPAAANHSVARR